MDHVETIRDRRSASIAKPEVAFPCAAAAGADSAAAVALPRALPQAPAMFISVVVPVFNRELVLRRCVDSVLAQEFGDFELILVDDGSTDTSLQRLREYDEPRVRVLVQGRNMGVGAARNAGAETAAGEWIVFLDSDDELVPGALRLIAELAAASSEEVGSLWFRCRMDDGGLCPEQLSEPCEWDYAGYVGFLEATVGQWRDMLRCTRRRCFREMREPTNRMNASKYLLDFARRFRIGARPEVLRLYHQDAGNQLVRKIAQLDPRRDGEIIRDRADGFRDLLRDHGAFVKKMAPRLYDDYLQSATTTAIMAGRRAAAFGYAVELIRQAPNQRRSWVLLCASVMGRAAVRLRRWTASRRQASPGSRPHSL
jgi:glycosyltransferase involved in cell wall biosynthesis